MLKIVADDKIPFLKGVLEPFAHVEYYPGGKINRDMVKNADALIIRTRTKCNRDLLHNTKVKFIATATIGFDHIDTHYCEEEGITWTNAPGCNSTSVQQYIATVLHFLSNTYAIDLTEKTLGIIGVGYVGKKILAMAEDLGLRVILNDPPRMRNEGPCGFISLDGLIKEADIITFHVPLIMEGEDKTFHLANDDFFSKLHKGSIVINSSRGEVIKTDSIKKAIQSGIIKSTVLDVWENEPEIDPELMSLTDIATPHIAGYSLDGKANGTAMSVNALCRFFKLPYTTWFPDDVTPVQHDVLKINCTGKGKEQVLLEAVQQTYDLLGDHHRLVNSVATFETQRGDYPLRREYQAYKVNPENGNAEIEALLAKYGFTVI